MQGEEAVLGEKNQDSIPMGKLTQKKEKVLTYPAGVGKPFPDKDDKEQTPESDVEVLRETICRVSSDPLMQNLLAQVVQT